MARTVTKMYENYILFNWDMLDKNEKYYLELDSLTTFQKIEELYDMLIYFLEKQEYEKCIVIQSNIDLIKKIYHKELTDKGLK